MSSLRTNRTLARICGSPTLAVAVAFALRMVLLWLSHRGENPPNPRLETTGLEAHLVASSLAAGKGFFGPFPGYQAPTAWVAPVYPLLWAIGERLLHPNFSGSVIFAQAMNCVFSAATCWPIFGIAKTVFSRRIGLASAWLWVFLPYAVLFPLEWSWDQSLSALILALIVCVTLRLSEHGSWPTLTAYGLLWALAAQTNPTLCILLPFLLGWSTVRRGEAGRLSFVSVAKVIFVFFLALGPWTVRNYFVLDGFVLVKSNFGVELWLGNNPAVKEIYAADLHPQNNKGELLSLILKGEPNYSREKQRQALAFIETHPRVFLRNVSERLADTWAATYDSWVDRWILALHVSRMNVWFCSVFSLISLMGMILALRTHWQDGLLLAMCPLLFPIPYYITHTALRYRHPIDPLLTIFTTFAIAGFWSACTAHRDRHPASEGAASEDLESVSVAR